MALFGSLGGLISNTLGSLGGAIGGSVGGLLGVGSQVIGGLLPSTGPVIGSVASAPPQQMALARSPGSIPAAGSAAMRMLSKGLTATAAQALIKIANATGRRTMTLRTAVRHIRRLGKFLGPAATAAALGITTAELAEIIVADSSRTRRRMNPANVHALRRSMRRISSFHRLAQKADALRGSRRRSSRGGSRTCGTNITQVR